MLFSIYSKDQPFWNEEEAMWSIKHPISQSLVRNELLLRTSKRDHPRNSVYMLDDVM